MIEDATISVPPGAYVYRDGTSEYDVIAFVIRQHSKVGAVVLYNGWPEVFTYSEDTQVVRVAEEK